MSHQRNPNTAVPSDGSRTITITNSQPRESTENGGESSTAGALRLRGAKPPRTHQQVAWGDDVVDNEGCGRKSSKICCIYHKPKRFDESSDESDSDSDSDASSCGHQHPHGHGHAPNPNRGATARPDAAGGETFVQGIEPKSEPNAYEANPSSKLGKRKADGS